MHLQELEGRLAALEQTNDELRDEIARAGDSANTIRSLQEQIQQMMQVHDKEMSELQDMLEGAEREKEKAEEVGIVLRVVRIGHM